MQWLQSNGYILKTSCRQHETFIEAVAHCRELDLSRLCCHLRGMKTGSLTVSTFHGSLGLFRATECTIFSLAIKQVWRFLQLLHSQQHAKRKQSLFINENHACAQREHTASKNQTTAEERSQGKNPHLTAKLLPHPDFISTRKVSFSLFPTHILLFDVLFTTPAVILWITWD